MRPQGRGWWSPAATAGAVGLFVAHHLSLYIVVPARHTFEDQTVLWDVARDLRRGDIRQLDFPGQFYGSSLEAIPTAGLGALGLSDHRAFSLSLLTLVVASWAALAGAVHRRGHPWLARSVLLVPVAMTVDYSASALMWATAAPRTLAIVTVAVVIAARRPAVRAATLIAAGGVAVLLDASTGLVLLPAAAWLAATDGPAVLRRRAGAASPVRAATVILGAATVPAGLALARAWHHGANPAYDLHPAPSNAPGWKPVEWHLGNPTRSLRTYGPEALASPLVRSVVVVLVLGAIAALVARRGTFAARAALAAAGLALVVFYTNEGSLRSAEFATTMLSVGRGLMSLPVLAVLLITVVADQVPARRAPLGFLALVLLCLAGFGVRAAVDSPGDFVDEIRATPAIDVWALDDVHSICAETSRLLRAPHGPHDAPHDAPVALSSSPTLAGACSAPLSGPTVLFPFYERRTWELARTWDTTQTTWLVLGRGAEGCGAFPAELACQVRGTELAEVVTAPLGPPEAAELLGLGLRRLPDDFPED